MLSNRCASPRPTPRQVFLGGVGLILTAVFTTLGLILIVAGLRGRRRDKVYSSNVAEVRQSRADERQGFSATQPTGLPGLHHSFRTWPTPSNGCRPSSVLRTRVL